MCLVTDGSLSLQDIVCRFLKGKVSSVEMGYATYEMLLCTGPA
jgi:hypothetical protein